MKAIRGPTRCNCFFWAKARQWRRGGYVVCHESRHFRWISHFAWSRDGKVWWSYSPVSPKSGWPVISHGPWFKGKVMRERVG